MNLIDKKIEKNFIKLYPKQFEDYTFFKYIDVKEALSKLQEKFNKFYTNPDNEEDFQEFKRFKFDEYTEMRLN